MNEERDWLIYYNDQPLHLTGHEYNELKQLSMGDSPKFEELVIFYLKRELGG